MPGDLKLIYSLSSDPDLKFLGDKSQQGVSLGSDEWWGMVEAGDIKSFEIKGVVTKVKWSSMGDWPSFEIMGDNGQVLEFTRKGGYPKYVEGLRAKVRYVLVPLGEPLRTLRQREDRELVTEIWLQASPRRTDKRPIGPEGMLKRVKEFGYAKAFEVEPEPDE